MADVDYGGRYGLVASRGGEGRPVGHGDLRRDGRAAGPRSPSRSPTSCRGRGWHAPARPPRRGRPRQRRRGLLRRGAAAEPPHDRDVPRERLPGRDSSEPGAIRVEFPTSFSPEAVGASRSATGSPPRPRCATSSSRGPLPSSAPRGGAARSAARSSTTCSSRVSTGSFIRSTRPPTSSSRCAPTERRRGARRGRPRRDRGSCRGGARRGARMRREGSPSAGRALRRLRRGRPARAPSASASSSRSAAAPGCGWSGPTASASSTPPRARASTPPSPPALPPPGNVGFVTQSGALGLALIDLAADRGLGVSSFASIGNRADVTANDFLEYWEGDEATAVALLYIESFSDPRRFARLARRIGRREADRRRQERPLRIR